MLHTACEYLFYIPQRHKARVILPLNLTYLFVADLAYPDAVILSLTQYEIIINHSSSTQCHH